MTKLKILAPCHSTHCASYKKFLETLDSEEDKTFLASAVNEDVDPQEIYHIYQIRISSLLELERKIDNDRNFLRSLSDLHGEKVSIAISSDQDPTIVVIRKKDDRYLTHFSFWENGGSFI